MCIRDRGDLDLDVLEAEVGVHRQRLLVERRDFGLDLVFGAEAVSYTHLGQPH